MLENGGGRAKMLLPLLAAESPALLVEAALAALTSIASDPLGCAFLRCDPLPIV